MAASDHWHDSRNYLRRVVALPCAQSRIDGERVDPGGRDFNHHLSRCVEDIAGGAITGILIAAKEMVGPLATIGHRIEEWQTAHNPFLSGPYADLLALIPFFIISLLLYFVGRDLLLVSRSKS